jgi:hypothetical protein
VDNLQKDLLNSIGIKRGDVKNVVQIIKDYYKKTATDAVNKRLDELHRNINSKSVIVKSDEDFLNNYEKSGKLYKMFEFFEKKNAQLEKESAEKEIQQNKEEIRTLESTKEKISK